MIYFDSDMSKSPNTVAYFDWKTVIYIYACGKCRAQFMLPMEKSVTFTSACANEIIPSINHLFVYKAKEGRYIRILHVQGRIQDFKLGGAHLKKLRRAEGSAKNFGVFRVKNHDFMPKNHIFSNFRGGARRVRLPLDPPLMYTYIHFNYFCYI
jgi:hypothetical protein